jgi:nucleoside-diphosphate-sugar epimerase
MLIFGMGYAAGHIAERLRARGWEVSDRDAGREIDQVCDLAAPARASRRRVGG